MIHHKLKADAFIGTTWSPSGKHLFLHQGNQKTHPTFEIWKCNENGVPLPSKPLILQTLLEPGLSVKNLTTAKRQMKKTESAASPRVSSAETASPDSSREVERIWLCCALRSQSELKLLGLSIGETPEGGGEPTALIEKHLQEPRFKSNCLRPHRLI